MQVRTASLIGEALPQRGFGFPGVGRAFSVRGPVTAVHLIGDNSDTSHDSSPDSLPCAALG